MKKLKVVNVESLLASLDSIELKELRKQFNEQVSINMAKIAEQEQFEMKRFVDNLHLTSKWGRDIEVVSLTRWNISTDHRRRLADISDRISDAFTDLGQLKCEVAQCAKREGISFSRRFHTTLKRMNRYKKEGF